MYIRTGTVDMWRCAATRTWTWHTVPTSHCTCFEFILCLHCICIYIVFAWHLMHFCCTDTGTWWEQRDLYKNCVLNWNYTKCTCVFVHVHWYMYVHVQYSTVQLQYSICMTVLLLTAGQACAYNIYLYMYTCIIIMCTIIICSLFIVYVHLIRM